MRRLSAAVLLAAGLLVPDSVRGQEDVSIYALLQPRGGALVVGERVEGSLTADDPVSESGRRVQVWLLTLRPGDEVQVDLTSGDFDAYLTVVGPGLGQGVTDDDGGSGLNSRVCFQAGAAGEYRVVAASLGGDTGSFRLSVLPNPGGLCGAATGDVEITDLTLLPTDGRVLTVETSVQGVLGEDDPVFYGSPVQAWTVAGRGGEPFSVDLVSRDFDAYLTVLGPGMDEWLTDDDGAGGCDARVTFEFPSTGEYRVVVGTLGSATGAFTLIPTREPGPVSDEPCVPMAADMDVEMDEGSLDDVSVVGDLAVPGTVTGTFRGDEGSFRGRPLQGWTLQGAADQRVALTLTSSDFDAYLFFRGPGFSEPLSDDDSAGSLNSRICVELPESGAYQVFAGPISSAPQGSTYDLDAVAGPDAEALCEGDFTLAPARVAAALATLDTDGRAVAVGEAVEGVLASGAPLHPGRARPVQPWLLRGAPGATVWVDVVSDAFDATLEVVWPGLPETLFNDDSGDGCNSRLEFTLPASGEALLLPGAWAEGASGPFLLRVSGEEPGPLEAGGCGGAGDAVGASSVDAGVLAGVTPSAGNVLEVGVDVFAYLDEGGDITVDGRPAQAWSFRGRQGDDLVFEVVSDDFDPVLWIGGPGLDGVLYDDDSAGALNPRIEAVLPAGGEFTVVVGALGEGTGSFRIRVLRRGGS